MGTQEQKRWATAGTGVPATFDYLAAFVRNITVEPDVSAIGTLLNFSNFAHVQPRHWYTLQFCVSKVKVQNICEKVYFPKKKTTNSTFPEVEKKTFFLLVF